MNLVLWLTITTLVLSIDLPSQGKASRAPETSVKKPIIADIAKPIHPEEPAPEPEHKTPDISASVTATAEPSNGPYHDIIIEAARRHKVDPAIVKAIIMAESSYNPKAVSKRGAMGLMQLMPITAKEMGVENIFDPEHNINGGVRYYKRLLKRYDGNVKLALAAYNAGSENVRKYRGVPPFKATRYYIRKVIKYYQQYKKELGPDQA